MTLTSFYDKAVYKPSLESQKYIREGMLRACQVPSEVEMEIYLSETCIYSKLSIIDTLPLGQHVYFSYLWFSHFQGGYCKCFEEQ